MRPYESIIFNILYMLNIMQTLMDQKRKERVEGTNAFENRETMREHNIQNIAHLSYYTNANGLLLVVLKKRGSAKFSLSDS